jgi:hypothetical protein
VFTIESKFLLNSIVEKNDSDNNSDDLILTGIASTTKERSLYGELMTEDALNQMCEQAIGLPILEAHKGDGLDRVIGVITNAFVEDSDLHIDFRVVPNHRERIQEFLDNGVPIGLSIGAQALIDNDTQKVTGVTLVEVSLTPIPANRVAHNTVTVKEDYYIGNCLHGICYQMIKDNFNMEDNNMADEKKANPEEVKEEEPLTIDKVKEMLDERFAEEKEALVATVVEEVKTELKKEAEASEEKVEDAFEEKPEDGEGDEKVEDDFSKEEVKDSVEKSEEVELSAPVIDEDKLVDSITKRILDSLGEKREEEIKDSVEDKEVKLDEDKIVESLTEKILNSIGEKRDVSGTKTETALQEPADTQEEDKPFTSEEAAKLIINDLNKKDPLTRAVNEARGL